MNELTEIKIEPEAMEVANVYLQTLSIEDTAFTLGLSKEEVNNYLEKAPVKSFLNAIFMEQGYLNKYKLQGIMDDVIQKKLDEMEEADLGSQKDIADLIKLQHKMRMDELKAMTELEKAKSPGRQTNVQVNNYGENYSALLQKLIGDK